MTYDAGAKQSFPGPDYVFVHRWQTWRCGAFGASPGVTIAAGHSPGHFSAALRLLSTHEHLLRNDMGAACKGEPTRRAGKLCTQLWHQADARAVLYLNSCGTTVHLFSSIFVQDQASAEGPRDVGLCSRLHVCGRSVNATLLCRLWGCWQGARTLPGGKGGERPGRGAICCAAAPGFANVSRMLRHRRG